MAPKKVLLILLTSVCIAQNNTETALQFQAKLNNDYSNPAKSPLLKTDLAAFKELDFYPIDEKYSVDAEVVLTKNSTVFTMKTATGRLPKYKKYAQLFFKINGKEYTLYVYQNIDLLMVKGFEDYLFLPFSDLTNGNESYIGGRYIDLRMPTANQIKIDFNKAYNPYCAYNYAYSCPIVPIENQLETEILAGVKKFHD